mmetsp:Transcript_22239/g.62389  ORF Transcript_22239/g.62389 Transcript_22239/m.62389 type:complete len:264 (-) Transcript_22239:1307-2098(-)
MGICSDMLYVGITGTPQNSMSLMASNWESAAAPVRMKRSLCEGARPPSREAARFSTAMWIVGTAEYHVGCGFPPVSSSRKAWASNLGMQVTEPPAATVARIEHERPPMWNSGMAFRQQSSCRSWRLAARTAPLEASAPALSGTTFGLDVVPDVRRSRPLPAAGFRQTCEPLPGTAGDSGLYKPEGPSGPAVHHAMAGPSFISATAASKPCAAVSRKHASTCGPNCSSALATSCWVAFGSRGAAHAWLEMASIRTAAAAPCGAG